MNILVAAWQGPCITIFWSGRHECPCHTASSLDQVPYSPLNTSARYDSSMCSYQRQIRPNQLMNTFMHGPSFFSFHFLSFSISFPKLTIFTILRLYMACKMWKITELTWEISSWRLVEKFHIPAFPMYYSLYNWIGGHEMTKKYLLIRIQKIFAYICFESRKKDTKTSTKRHEWNGMTQNGLFDNFRNAHA